MAATTSAPPLPFSIHVVSSSESPEFVFLVHSVQNSSVVGLDAEWKPRRCRDASTPPEAKFSIFPPVALLQIACRLRDPSASEATPVFLVDLLSVPAPELWGILNALFDSPEVLKLGFRFKQDLIYLSSTFVAQGCDSGFNGVAPFLDINNIYHHFNSRHFGKKGQRETRSLATICEELLSITLSKELQCSDWSCRPLSQEQLQYAAADAYYLIAIFEIFRKKIMAEESIGNKAPSIASNILEVSSCDDKYIECIVNKYSECIFLKESDKKPKQSRRKEKQLGDGKKKGAVQPDCGWQGITPWDSSVGGNGSPKFLCDIMIEGLAKHLRCVGIDAATPSVRRPDARILLDQAYKEKRVLLTRDARLLKYQYLGGNQVYRVKNLLKNDQLLEIIDTFKLKISEEQLMTRCTKCNGSFIQKSLTLEEAVEASKGFQTIPDCLFHKNLEFWQCRDCRQLYWEGTQYQHAVKKFMTVCNISD